MEIFELLLDGLRTACAGFPDSRRSTDVDYSLADIGLSAFSLFFMQSESFLAHQRHLERGQGMVDDGEDGGGRAYPKSKRRDCRQGNSSHHWRFSSAKLLAIVASRNRISPTLKRQSALSLIK
jgi:hypothetical protein